MFNSLQLILLSSVSIDIQGKTRFSEKFWKKFWNDKLPNLTNLSNVIRHETFYMSLIISKISINIQILFYSNNDESFVTIDSIYINGSLIADIYLGNRSCSFIVCKTTNDTWDMNWRSSQKWTILQIVSSDTERILFFKKFYFN